MAKAAYIGVSNATPRDLPSGYTQLAYIQSTGTQYINTEYKAVSENYRIKCKFTVINYAANNVLFGGGASTDIISVLLNSETQLKFYVGSGSVGDALSTFSCGTKHEMECYANGGTFTVNLDGVSRSGSYSGTINKDYPLFVFANNSSGTAAQFSSMRVAEFQIYDNGTLVRDYVPCKNSSGTVGLYDVANGKFYTNAGTGTFTAGATIGSFARKIKKMYIGINGEARKVKKAYIGVAGVARLFFAGGELKSYGTVASLANNTRYGVSGGSFGNLALFAGGMWGTASALGYIDYYDTSLTRGTTPYADKLSHDRCLMGVANTGDYIVFAGGLAGSSGNSTSPARDVDAYNPSLTHTTLSNLTNYGMGIAGTSIGGYALFAGGRYNAANPHGTAYAYDSSLTRTSPTSLSKARNSVGATTIGGYALFGGGNSTASSSSSSYSSVVDAYNTSLTRSTITALSVTRANCMATTVGDYAIFLGGDTTTDVYNSSLTKSMGPTVAQNNLSMGTTLENYALFGGNSYTAYTGMIVIDDSLTYNSSFALSTPRYYVGAAIVGDYALFAGGQSGSTKYTTVDAFVLD